MICSFPFSALCATLNTLHIYDMGRICVTLFLAMYVCSCKLCCSTFTTLSEYVRHNQHNHKAYGDKFPCYVQECNSFFKCYSAFATHCRRSHTKEARASSDLTCSVNSCAVELSYESVLPHLRNHLAEAETVSCPFPECSGLKLGTYSSLSVHVSRMHRLPATRTDEVQDPLSFVQSDLPLDSHVDSNSQEDMDVLRRVQVSESSFFSSVSSESVDNISRESQTEAIAMLLMNMVAGKHVPLRTVNTLLQDAASISDAATSALERRVSHHFTNFTYSGQDSFQELKDTVLSDIRSVQPFGPCKLGGELATPHLSMLYFKRHMGFTEPQLHRLTRVGQEHEKQVCSFVPVSQTLKRLLDDSSVMSRLDFPAPVETSEMYGDFVHGTRYRELGLPEHALCLIMYQDAFEIVNPLGSAKKSTNCWVFTILLGT